MEKVTELDKLIHKINQVYEELGGEVSNEPKQYDVSKIKDRFEQLKVEISRGLADLEALLNEKENLPQQADKIQQKYMLESKIDEKLNDLNKKMKEIKVEMKSYKKKNSKNTEEIEAREAILGNFDKRYMLSKNRSEGIPIDVEDLKRTREEFNVGDLDKAIKQGEGPERELYQEEKDKMDEWDRRVDVQNKGLAMIHKDIKDLKSDMKVIGTQIDDVGKMTKKTKSSADRTEAKLKSTNERLKNMLEKLRSSDKICVDIILVFVCLGLSVVLYNVIKSQL